MLMKQNYMTLLKNRHLAQNPYNKRNEAAALAYLAIEIKKIKRLYPLNLKAK